MPYFDHNRAKQSLDMIDIALNETLLERDPFEMRRLNCKAVRLAVLSAPLEKIDKCGAFGAGFGKLDIWWNNKPTRTMAWMLDNPLAEKYDDNTLGVPLPKWLTWEEALVMATSGTLAHDMDQKTSFRPDGKGPMMGTSGLAGAISTGERAIAVSGFQDAVCGEAYNHGVAKLLGVMWQQPATEPLKIATTEQNLLNLFRVVDAAVADYYTRSCALSDRAKILPELLDAIDSLFDEQA